MCESNVYSIEGTKIMEDVIKISIEGDKIKMEDILKRKEELKGKIVVMDLENHKISIEVLN